MAHSRLEDILLRGLQKNKTFFSIDGTASPSAISYFIAQSLSKEINQLPRLVVFSSLEAALSFRSHLEFFSPYFRTHLLHHHDVSYYSGLYP